MFIALRFFHFHVPHNFTLTLLPSFLLSSPVKADLPENYGERSWEKLKQAIHAVHHQEAISYSLEELYQAVENMCSHKMATKLYDNLRVELEGHVTSLSPVFREEIDYLQFLIVVDKQWRDHCQHMVSRLYCVCMCIPTCIWLSMHTAGIV